MAPELQANAEYGKKDGSIRFHRKTFQEKYFFSGARTRTEVLRKHRLKLLARLERASMIFERRTVGFRHVLINNFQRATAIFRVGLQLISPAEKQEFGPYELSFDVLTGAKSHSSFKY